MRHRALAFDTGGTVLDWHGSIVDELGAVSTWQTLSFDRHEFVNEWRRRTMKGIVGQLRPDFHMDDVHLRTLAETIGHFGLPALDSTQLQALWRAWHRLRAWPDFAPALARLREKAPVVSFTMLPTALVLDVSRLNGLVWDAVISCQMIGVYKPHAEAYHIAAAWLGLAPSDILMVACHNFDLNAAQDAGMHTAFVRRPDEWGPAGPPDPTPNRKYNLVVEGFDELQERLLAED
ncbi:HAD-IA family hydrolase [Variovorax paradoxus]|nr:HAD-IA family hydrolase [Variovorax paradoxus]